MKISTLKGTRFAQTLTALFVCKAGAMHDRRAPRGGSRNSQREILEESEGTEADIRFEQDCWD